MLKPLNQMEQFGHGDPECKVNSGVPVWPVSISQQNEPLTGPQAAPNCKNSNVPVKVQWSKVKFQPFIEME